MIVYTYCQKTQKLTLNLCYSSLKMDRWKLKELKQMELGGNKAAQAFFEENGMYKDGKVDHESPMHSRWKMELSAKAEAAIKEILQARGKSSHSND